MAVSRGRFVALSTAFSKSGWFFQQWNDAAETYLRLSVTASQCPRYDPVFLERERRRLGERWYGMEYENVFADDISAVFSTDDIGAALSDGVQPFRWYH